MPIKIVSPSSVTNPQEERAPDELAAYFARVPSGEAQRGAGQKWTSPDEGHLSPAHDEAGAVAGHGALAPHRLGAACNLSTSGGGMKAPEKIGHGPENSLSEIRDSCGSICERDEVADRRHPGSGPRPLRLDPEGERIFRDFAVLGRDQFKTARSGLEADLVRLEADPPGPDPELPSLNSALHASAEVLGELGQDMHRDEEDMGRDGEIRFAVEKGRTGQTKERCGCTEVRHGQPEVRSMSDATRLRSTAERAGPNEVEGGLQEVRRRQQKVRNRDDEVRVQSSTSRLASLEDRAESMTRSLVTDEVQLRVRAFRSEPAQDLPRMEEASAGHQQVRVGDKKVRTEGKKVRIRGTEVGNASTEVRFESSRVRSRSGTPRRRSSKASSQLLTAMFSHINEGIFMANTTNQTNRPVAVLNLPKKSVHGLITHATRVVKAMTANPAFPVPTTGSTPSTQRPGSSWRPRSRPRRP
jgi:hypothetical protein